VTRASVALAVAATLIGGTMLAAADVVTYAASGSAASADADARTRALDTAFASAVTEAVADLAGKAARAKAAEVDREITPLLIHAERRAREHARVAQVLTGAIPIAARRAYARARTSDVTTLEGKLDALSSYGRSSEASRLVVMLARIAPSAATSSGD